MLRRWNSTLLLLATLLCSAPLFAASYTKLLLIGDSLSDTGNLYALTSSFGFPTPPPPYSNGRFSNGPVYAEYLSSSLGLGAVVTPSLLGGNNYAYGNSLVSATALGFIPSLPAQRDALIANSGGTLDAGALYVVWGGNNDLFGLLDLSLPDPLTAQALVNGVADTLVGTIADLVTHGAQHLLVPNIPDLGLTPREAANAANATQYSQWFNDRLSSGLAAIQGADILLFDTFATLREGTTVFAYSTEGCLLLASCDDYLFFDDVHPTTAAHELLAERMHAQLTAVPLPAGVWLLGSGLMLLAVRRRSH